MSHHVCSYATKRFLASCRFSHLRVRFQYEVCPLPTYNYGDYSPRQLLFSKLLCLAIISTWTNPCGKPPIISNNCIT